MNAAIRIEHTEVWGRYRRRYWIYRLESDLPIHNSKGIRINYEGRGLDRIRVHARRIAAERGTTWKEAWA